MIPEIPVAHWMIIRQGLVIGAFLMGALLLIRIYGHAGAARWLRGKDGEPSLTKAGVLVAGCAWTYYMVVVMPDDIMMWVAYYTAVACTDLFKQFVTMFFQWKSGIPMPTPQQTVTTTVRPEKTTVKVEGGPPVEVLPPGGAG